MYTEQFAVPGVLYLIHFDRRIGGEGRNGAQHYMGWAEDPDERLSAHRNGRGARILAFCNQAGIDYDIVATWPGNRYDERRIKKAGHHERRCPTCKGGVR